MRLLFAIMMVSVLGCAAYAAEWQYGTSALGGDITQNSNLMEAMPFYEMPTKLHAVDRSHGETITQFMVLPNDFQVCACTVRGEFLSCYCTQPEIGICAEHRL